MSDWLRVAPEDMHLSASTVDTHADNMRTKHGAADSRTEESMRGLPAGAARALEAKVTEWQTTTSTLYSNMASHSDGLRMGALKYSQNDETSASDIEKAASQIPDLGV